MVESRKDRLPANLEAIHSDVFTRVQSGDPTPFKAFREREYLATVARLGQLSSGTPVDVLLDQEILMTQEVHSLAKKWQERGALLFGLSDKPDEASLPTPELKSQGYQAIHQMETHVVGA